MPRTVNSNYGSCAAPGSTFNARVDDDTYLWLRNDLDSVGSALDEHDHSSGKGLPAARIGTASAPVTITGTPSAGQRLIATSATAAHWA